MLLELLLFLAAIGVPAAYAASDNKPSSSGRKSYETYESIRVYPTERKATRYYDGEREEYYY
jgi:hypothetical protein